MFDRKQIIGGSQEFGGRILFRANGVRPFVFLNDQIPMRESAPMIDGTVEHQTCILLDDITVTFAEPDCARDEVIWATVWLRDRNDFHHFDAVYGECVPVEPPARSAVVSDLLVDARVEVMILACRPLASNGR